MVPVQGLTFLGIVFEQMLLAQGKIFDYERVDANKHRAAAAGEKIHPPPEFEWFERR
jgi:hypothetical protein